MKNLLTGALLIGIVATSFAKEIRDEGVQTGFYGYKKHDVSKKNKKTNTKIKPVPFFIGYRFIFANQSDDQNLVATVTDNSKTPLKTNKVHLNWNWDIGHEGVVGVNFSNTFFSLFANGQYLHHNKTINSKVAPGNIQPFGILSGTLPAGSNQAEAAITGNTCFWKAGLFLAYAAYRQGSFFLTPYIGPQYYFHQNKFTSTFTDTTNNVTVKPFTIVKHQGIGPLLGMMGKYYFNKVFYAYGDAKLALPMTRTHTETFTDSNDGKTTGQELTIETQTKLDLMFHEGVGIGFEIRNHSWETDLIFSYETVSFTDTKIAYHVLGASLVIGF